MISTRDQELWGVALWVEKTHGESGWFHIAQQRDRLLKEGDLDGEAMWREVSLRYNLLDRSIKANSQLTQ